MRADLAAAGRRPGHFGPVGQADRHGDLFGRHVAGILQQDLVGRFLADHDLPRSDGFHRQQRALVIDQDARLLCGVAGRLGRRQMLRFGGSRGAWRTSRPAASRQSACAGQPPHVRPAGCAAGSAGAADRRRIMLSAALSGPCRRTATGGRPSAARAAASRWRARNADDMAASPPAAILGDGGLSAGPPVRSHRHIGRSNCCPWPDSAAA